MTDVAEPLAITPVLIDGLYREAMSLAEEARTYFDSAGQWDRKKLSADQRVTFACESLKVTTRLMHVISWLLIRKAVDAGEMSERDGLAADRRLGKASATYADDAPRIKSLPRPSIRLILKSQDLYMRVRRLEDELLDASTSAAAQGGPARTLMQKLEAAF
jgi:regulator of CtrA degradation